MAKTNPRRSPRFRGVGRLRKSRMRSFPTGNRSRGTNSVEESPAGSNANASAQPRPRQDFPAEARASYHSLADKSRSSMMVWNDER